MAVPVQRVGLDALGTTAGRRGALLPAVALGIVVLAPLAVLLSTVLLLGWQLQVIETGSMRPHLPAGSLAVVEPLDAADVRAGMVIVLEDRTGHGRLVAHRAVKRLPGEVPVWETQGDANARPDPYPVHAPAIRGRVRWTIPHLGAVASSLRTPVTPALLIGVPLALLAGTEIVALRRRRRPRGRPASEAHGRDHVRVYAVHDVSSTPSGIVEVFARSDDAERLVAYLGREQPLLADTLVILEHELSAPGTTAGAPGT